MSQPLISARAKRARFARTFLTAVLFSCACSWPAALIAAPIFQFSGFSSDGHPVSGSADFTLNAGADTVTVKLTNTTTTTLDAGELFTGLDFSLGGLTPTMTSDTGIQRTVAANGTFSDTGAAQDLSWSLVSLGGGSYQLNFNPDAKDAIIGPPAMGSYSLADDSIKGNAGHTPFAAEMAVFQLNVPGLEADTPVEVNTWRFGTRLDPADPGVPEPLSSILLLIGIATMACPHRR